MLDSNYFGQGSSAGNEWVTVSLKQANIKFPPFGVIVVMEWLPLAKDKVTKKPWGNNEIVYHGQCLGGTNEFKYINNYFNYRHGSELKKEMPIEGVKMFNYLNPMIRLELDIVK